MPLVDVPITVTNAQGTDTPAPFQQMIQFNPSLYSSFLMSDLSNIRFTDEDYSALPAWLESYSSTSATAWVRLNDGIKAGQSRILHMLIASVGFDGQFWGEAPQLSPTYGQYDSGANVFYLYDNFAGTSLNTSIWEAYTQYDSVTVNNGITIQAPASGNGGGIVSKIGVPPDTIFEVYRESQVAGSYSTYGIALFNTNVLSNTVSGYEYVGWSSGYFASTSTTYSSSHAISIATPFPSAPAIVGIAWLSTGSEYTEIGSNGAFTHYTDTSLQISSLIYPGLGNSCCSPNTAQTDLWVRVRAYPPGGVMPGVTVGSPKIYNYGYIVYPW